MDKREETTRIVKSLNDFDKGIIHDSEFIKRVCNYYDLVKDDLLSESDIKFLRFLANRAGIPQYFELLTHFNKLIEENNCIDINTLSSIIYESTLHTTQNIILHRYQKQILDFFKKGYRNRYFLSATTSFGKTFLVYEIIRKLQYNNIMLIFPSVALLSENLDKVFHLNQDDSFAPLEKSFAIHTLSDINQDDLGERNIFIYTPERYLSFIENKQTDVSFDFVFIDEIYKIDNDFIIDEESQENERDVAYRMATYYCTLNNHSDLLLAGPYIEIGNRPQSSFFRFLESNQIIALQYNNFEIVSKDVEEVQKKSNFAIDDDIVNFHATGKTGRLVEISNTLVNTKNENLIIYCASPSWTEFYANKLIASGLFESHDYSIYNNFINHLKNKINPNWVLVKALCNGIGIHHGSVPKYIQKYIIQLFNSGYLKILVCTTTITEGVNTNAKNIVVLHAKKGDKALKPFDAKNIKGRAGRFQHHFKGRLISLERDFNIILEAEDSNIQHKNYDAETKKDEIDFFMTEDQFLNNRDKVKKQEVIDLSTEFPQEIFESYKMVKRTDKIKLYNIIHKLVYNGSISISELNRNVYARTGIGWSELQSIINVCNNIIPDESVLKHLIERKRISQYDNNEYSNLVFLLYAYVKHGVSGMIKYYANKADVSKLDAEIRNTTKLIFNTFKYQLVKYLGTFNLIYKTILAKKNQTSIDDEQGIENFLSLLEYNAFSKNGKIASDYGVPHEVVKIIDSNSINIKTLDSFEISVYQDIIARFNF